MHYNRLAHIWEHLSKAFQYCYAAWHHEQSPISECVMHHSSIHLSEQAWSLPVSPNKYWNINVILCLCLCLPCFDFYSRNQFDFINDEINFQQSNCTLNFMICCWHVAKTLTEYFRYLSHEFSHSISISLVHWILSLYLQRSITVEVILIRFWRPHWNGDVEAIAISIIWLYIGWELVLVLFYRCLCINMM